MISYQTLALWINIAIVAAVAAGAFRRRGTTGAVALIVLCAMVATWTVSLLVPEAAGPTLQSSASAVSDVMALLAASAVFLIILVRTNRGGLVHWRNILLFAAIPLLILAVFGVRGPSGSLHATVQLYVFVMALGSALLLLGSFLQRRRPVLSSLGLAFLGSLLPVAALILEATGSSPFPGLSLPPLAFGLCAMGFLNGLFDRRPEEIGAIDRHAAVEGMDEGWIVLDVNDTVVDMNPAAERMTGSPREQILGQPISSLLGDLSNLGLTLNTSQEVEMKRSIRLEEGWRYLNIRISTLMDRDRTAFGRLTLWRDMTDRKLTDDSRNRARDEMFVLMNAISFAASNTINTEEFLLESIYQMFYPFGSQVVAVFLMEEKGKRQRETRLQLAAHVGLPEESIEDLTTLQTHSPMFHWAMTNREPVQIADAAHNERVPGAIRRIPADNVLVLPLIAQTGENGKVLGCMLITRKDKPEFSQDEIVRLTTLAEHMANLLDSDRRRKLAITMNERTRLMQDLHDSVSQRLYALVTTTEVAQAAMEAGAGVDPRQEFARIGENARQAVKEMRLFLYQMQQVDVEKEGLVQVLHQRLAAVEGRATVRAQLLAEEEQLPLSTEKQMTLYYIATEALNNVLRHARAKSVLVTLKSGPKNVILEIVDDGVGFDLKKVDQAGLGLRNMRERVMQMKGKLQIVTNPNEGTRIIVAVPRDADITPAPHG